MYKWIFKDKAGRLVNKGYEYKLGKLHVMDNFNASKECTNNAFYYCAAKDIHLWSELGTHLFEIHVPEDAQIIDLDDKYKVDRLVIVRELEWPEILELNPYIIRNVPEHLITPKRYLAAARQNGWALQLVPKHLITQEMCIEAVRQNNWTLQLVPKHLITQEMCTVAVGQCGMIIQYVPKHLITPEMCLAAVCENGYAVRYVPEDLKTEEICLGAVRQCGWALRCVPGHLKTEKICLNAVHQCAHVLVLQHVPDHLRIKMI